jgi:hypothetical protein
MTAEQRLNIGHATCGVYACYPIEKVATEDSTPIDHSMITTAMCPWLESKAWMCLVGRCSTQRARAESQIKFLRIQSCKSEARWALGEPEGWGERVLAV